MQAIEVKYLPVINNKGSRLKAFCQDKSITMGLYTIQAKLSEMNINHSMENCARFIAEQLRLQLDWNEQYSGKMVCGELKNGNYVFVFTKE